jgi:GNAT superfamily N-acetyltransferase
MTMSVEKATGDDLDAILGWLEREYAEDDGEGFWCNRTIIERSLERGDLWVIRHDGEAVAFQVSDHAADIACVRKDRQRQGLGTELFKASLARAIRDDVVVLAGECAPRTSLPFWQKHGFVRYGDMSEWAPITVRLVLQRSHAIPQDRPTVEVTIGFYPEAATYRDNVPPIAVHSLRGARLDSGVIMLERRVIGVRSDEPNGDLAVKIEVDGVQRCFCKAKYDKAVEAGVQPDRDGRAFYVDVIPDERTTGD